MRVQASALQTKTSLFPKTKLGKLCWSLLVGGSFLLAAPSSFAYSISHQGYEQGHMEISKEHFQATMASPTYTGKSANTTAQGASAKNSAKQGPVELSPEQKAKMQELAQTLPKMPQPILTEIARLSLNKDLLLIFGADKFYTFLGCVNCSTKEALSIWNAQGPYGSSQSPYSIWSAHNEFGNAAAQYSPWNNFGRKPPFLIDTKGNVHGVLTINRVNQHQSQGQIANFLYQNHEQIRLDPSSWFSTLFKNNTDAVLEVPETLSDNQESDLNPEVLQASRQ